MTSFLSHLMRHLAIATLATAAVAAPASEGRWTYEVTVTNITYNQRFTPLLLATHKPDIRFFTPGQAAMPELATLAEEGNIAPLRTLFDGAAPGWPAQTYTAVAYDAGSEVNDQLCTSIPGPAFAECGGSGGGARVGGGEGFVHVHRGMHDVGDFKALARDWRNPVATVSVRLVR